MTCIPCDLREAYYKHAKHYGKMMKTDRDADGCTLIVRIPGFPEFWIDDETAQWGIEYLENNDGVTPEQVHTELLRFHTEKI